MFIEVRQAVQLSAEQEIPAAIRDERSSGKSYGKNRRFSIFPVKQRPSERRLPNGPVAVDWHLSAKLNFPLYIASNAAVRCASKNVVAAVNKADGIHLAKLAT